MFYISQIFSIIRKDITAELRTKTSIGAMLLFGLTIIVVFSFAFNLDLQEQKSITPGLLWTAFTFAAILGLNYSFSSEYENGCMQGLLLSPIPRSAIYIGKLISNFIFIFFSEIIILGFFVWLFDVRFTLNWHWLTLVIIFGTIGFSATGTLFAAISAETRMKVFILPLLQFPITIPVVIAAVEATAILLGNDTRFRFQDWATMLVVFDVIFVTISIMLFEYILEE
ncbi:MAG: ABC transporter permease subunit [bacterium]|nr:ABC transporter permease subunit [bacterium]